MNLPRQVKNEITESIILTLREIETLGVRDLNDPLHRRLYELRTIARDKRNVYPL